MLRVSQLVFCRQILRSFIRCCNSAQSLPKVKVYNSEEENLVKISFKYGNFPGIGKIYFQVARNHTLQEVFQRINLMVNITKKKVELRKSAINRLTGSGNIVEEDENENDCEVSVLKGDEVINKSVKNVVAWEEGTTLKIGDSLFEICYNAPAVVDLRLPECILGGCMFRPRFSFECCSVEDSEFVWFRSKSEETDCLENDDNWIKVGEGYMYQSTSEDIGHKLKLICTPKCGNKIGEPYTVYSKNTVEKGPEIFPFEERQQYTSELVDSDCIRCISYNVLANIYTERKKFPYCNRKALDIFYRKQLLLKELLGYNCDILCLQEVQERVFTYDISPVLKKINMEGIFNKKGGRVYEGLALFYRPTKFRVLDNKVIYLNEVIKKKEIFDDMLTKISGNYKDMSKLLAQDTALQLVLLQHIEQPKKRVLVANTHLYSNKDTPEVRLYQAALCTFYSEYVLKSLENEGSTAFIFCGDFNSLPGSAAHQFIQTGSYTCSSSWKNNSADGIDMTLRHNLTLESACGTPLYTNYTETFQGCLDYIFYTVNDFNVKEVVPIPPYEIVKEQVALPSEFFPSDHIPLICTLKWRTWNNNEQ